MRLPWLGGTTFVAASAQRIEGGYQFLSSFSDESPNSLAFEDLQAVLYFRAVAELLICDIPGFYFPKTFW